MFRSNHSGYFIMLMIALLFSNGYIKAQHCLPGLFGDRIIKICNPACTKISLSAPNLKSSSNYKVSNIEYVPYNFVTLEGNTDTTFYDIEYFSNKFNFGFQFCFYDSIYTSAVLSNYGFLTFDTIISRCRNNPNVTPIPSAYGVGCGSTGYSTKASVFACYTYLNSRLSPIFNTVVSPSDRKIEWRVIGTAPCRKLIVSYYHIGSAANPDCSLITPATFQMVMHESTGLIDIFFENYSCPEFYNNGETVCGIQNWNRDKGITPPGKNGTAWTAYHEGYRFTPSAGASRFVSSKLYNTSGSFIADADTITNSSDSSLLSLNFNNVCPASDSTAYLVETKFTALITGDTISSIDTVWIIRRQLNPAINYQGTGSLATGSFNSYQWLLNNATIPNANGAVYTPTVSGSYQVVVTDTTGCRDTSLAVNFSVVPIKLLNFTARYNGRAIMINWQTAQEQNSSHFTVGEVL